MKGAVDTVKRYWFTLLLALFAVAGLGAFYAYGADNHLPNFKLSVIRGDAREGANIELSGAYGGRMRSEYVAVTAAGSDYTSNHSMYEENITDARAWLYSEPGMRHLLDKYGKFMRGKTGAAGFYEDESWLAYASSDAGKGDPFNPEMTVSVELLHRDTGQTERFVTRPEGYRSIQALDVQRDEERLRILVSANPDPSLAGAERFVRSGVRNDYFVMTLDTGTGKWTSGNPVSFGAEARAGYERHVSFVASEPFYAPAGQAAFAVYEEKTSGDGGAVSISVSAEPRPVNLYGYRYETGELTQLPVSLTQSVGNRPQFELDGSQLTFWSGDEEGVAVGRYDLQSGKEMPAVGRVEGTRLDADRLMQSVVRKDRLYVLYSRNGIPQVAVLQATDGNMLYEGQVICDSGGVDKGKEIADLSLLNIALDD